MKNGTYKTKLKVTGTEITFTSHNGVIRLNNGRVISETTLKEHYAEPEKITGEGKIYNIHYIVGGIVKEVINTRASMAVCKWKISQMKQSYKQGKLITVRAI